MNQFQIPGEEEEITNNWVMEIKKFANRKIETSVRLFVHTSLAEKLELYRLMQNEANHAIVPKLPKIYIVKRS